MKGNFESYYFAVNAEKRIIKRIIGDIYLSVLLGEIVFVLFRQ
jgi:hypothetical protein